MSRPHDLPIPLQTWATGNYAAGSNSWSGQPQRLAPGAPFVPGLTLPAPVENYLHGNAYDVAQGALNLAGQLPPLNWGAAVAIGAAPANIVWSDFQQRWYAPLGGTASTSIYLSSDFGKTWSSTTMSASISALDAAVDVSGNIVVLASNGTSLKGLAGATYSAALTWSSTLATTFVAGTLAYDANALGVQWFAAGASSAGAISAYQTPAGLTSSWTTPSLPTTWTSTTAGKSVVIGASGTGTVVLAFIDTTSTFRTLVRNPTTGIYGNDTQHTVDPGVGTVTINISTEPRLISRPIWSTVDSLWYLSVSGNTGSQVWSSPDGSTWTSVRVFSGNQTYSLVCLGALLIALDVTGMVEASWDKGVTWRRCGQVSSAAGVTALRAGGGGLLAFSSSSSFASTRFGIPTAVF
jgi:hypothetical protein